MPVFLQGLTPTAIEHASAACSSPQQVLAAGTVIEHPLNPATLGLALSAAGLSVNRTADVVWKQCAVHLQPRVYGGWAITDSGVPVMPVDRRLMTRDDPVPSPEAEPDHPIIAGARFVSSTSLAIGSQRAGLWAMADGTFLIARYDPQTAAAPIPLFTSSLPVLGVFYIGAPDAPGGMFQFWQRISDGSYRYVGVSWTEQGAR